MIIVPDVVMVDCLKVAVLRIRSNTIKLYQCQKRFSEGGISMMISTSKVIPEITNPG